MDVQDASGLHYVSLINQISVDSKGSAESDDIIHHMEADIYDEKGNLIYAVDESLYK